MVDCIPDDPQDNNEDESSDNDDREKLSNSGDSQQDSDKDVDHDSDFVGSEDQDELMLKTNTDTICLNDNILDSGGRSGKNRTKISIYNDYLALPTEVIPINLPFSTKDIISSFQLNDGVEVSEDDIPLDLLKICGKKVYFLQANSVLITKLKKQNKKFQEREDFTIMHLHGNKEDYVVYLNEKNIRECNVPERFNVLTKYNQYNWIVPKASFFILTICFSFLINCVVRAIIF